MDNLKNAALSFQRLFDFEYHITLKKKDKLYYLILEFRKQDFFHLAGLHYLKDLPQLKKNRDLIFDEIINNKITEETVRKSCFYKHIEERIIGLIGLEEILDSNKTVFRYCKNRSSFSDIIAEYFLETVFLSKTNYIFIDKNEENKLYCKSFFFNENNNYRINQIYMDLILKEKTNKKTNEKFLLFEKQIKQ